MKNYTIRACKRIILILLSPFILTQLASCIDTDSDSITQEEILSAQEYLDQALAGIDQGQLALDLSIIDDSLETAGLTDQVLVEPHGVRYVIKSEGTGVTPMLENIVQIKYSGKILSSGIEFDANDNYENFLYGLIIGFQTTLPLLPSGTEATLYIPSVYAYGATDVIDEDTGQLIVPANSILVFEIELLEVY